MLLQQTNFTHAPFDRHFNKSQNRINHSTDKCRLRSSPGLRLFALNCPADPLFVPGVGAAGLGRCPKKIVVNIDVIVIVIIKIYSRAFFSVSGVALLHSRASLRVLKCRVEAF